MWVCFRTRLVRLLAQHVSLRSGTLLLPVKSLRNGKKLRLQTWTQLSRERLLDVRIGDLELPWKGSALAARVARLHDELNRAGLVRFRPHVWLSTDWFTPDGVPGFAIPFVLSHPRLARLEREHLLEVEGGTTDWCMQILRHEAGHALDNAYRLHGRKGWREVFGPFSAPYRDAYVPSPLSRKYVLHLDAWYAQSHPCEDWAETFAVWLAPGSRWRTRYQGWGALKKLQYVDGLMKEIGSAPPRVASRVTPDSAATLRMTLREYFQEKQARYKSDEPEAFDANLLRVFRTKEAAPKAPRAARFLAEAESELRVLVAKVTGHHPYLVRQILKDVVRRCRALELRVGDSRDTMAEAGVLLTTLMTGALRGGHREFHR